MEYKLIRAELETEFLELVNKAINEGWIPQGGLALDSMYYFQAMIKNEK
jgi:hypothetical protein